EVGGQGDHRPGSCGHSVDRRHHGNRDLTDRLDDCARHAGEIEQRPGIHIEEATDDLVDVSARAETATGAGDDDRSDVVAMRYLAEEVAEVCVHVEGEGVETVGPREGQGGNPVVDRQIEVAPFLGEAGRSAKRAHFWSPPPSNTML